MSWSICAVTTEDLILLIYKEQEFIFSQFWMLGIKRSRQQHLSGMGFLVVCLRGGGMQFPHVAKGKGQRSKTSQTCHIFNNSNIPPM